MVNQTLAFKDHLKPIVIRRVVAARNHHAAFRVRVTGRII